MRAPALFRQVRAFLTDYFWRPCPLCGDYFAGYEWTEIDQFTLAPSGTSTAICRACIPEARAIAAMAVMDELTPERRERIREAVRADPEFMAGVREGLKARAEDRMVPWSEVKKELGIE